MLVDGGGNDLNDGCECRQCDAVMEEIITADAEQGAMADFVEQIVDDGYNVALMGYYKMPGNAEYGFDQCNDEPRCLVAALSIAGRALRAGHFHLIFAKWSVHRALHRPMMRTRSIPRPRGGG